MQQKQQIQPPCGNSKQMRKSNNTSIHQQRGLVIKTQEHLTTATPPASSRKQRAHKTISFSARRITCNSSTHTAAHDYTNTAIMPTSCGVCAPRPAFSCHSCCTSAPTKTCCAAKPTRQWVECGIKRSCSATTKLKQEKPLRVHLATEVSATRRS